MSTQLVISKLASGHNIQVTVQRSTPPEPEVFTLGDGECRSIVLYDGVTVSAVEIPKTPAAAS